ncbi:MAG TPA: hypothetical protein VGT78_13415 [Rhizomicrobium sp.]|nr:hypothetical protein [Rhizomicrobium sp.]
MVADFAHGIQTSFLATMNHAKAKPAVAPAATDNTASSSDSGFSFDDLIDIVNPLQHIPIVSTLYRHITGDTIKPLEKIAGDTLYGGLTGLGSSVADFAFQKITGKNLGDTVLAFVLGDDKPATGVAAATPPANAQAALATRAPTPLLGAMQIPSVQTAADKSTDVLMAAARREGISSDLALRALSAYQKSLGVPARIADAATQ